MTRMRRSRVCYELDKSRIEHRTHIPLSSMHQAPISPSFPLFLSCNLTTSSHPLHPPSLPTPSYSTRPLHKTLQRQLLHSLSILHVLQHSQILAHQPGHVLRPISHHHCARWNHARLRTQHSDLFLRFVNIRNVDVSAHARVAYHVVRIRRGRGRDCDEGVLQRR
jgi:hypothetical protein